MANTDFSVSLSAELKDFKAKMAAVPGIGKKEAIALQKEFVREFRKMERAAAKTGKATAHEISEGMDKAKDATERAAGLMGGVFGDISDSIFDLGEKIVSTSTAIGGVAGAATLAAGSVAALTAASVFAAGAFLEWMDGIEEVRESLELVEGIEPLSPEHEAALRKYEEASRDADAAIAAASLTMRADFADAATDMQHAIVGLNSVMSDMTGETWSLAEATENWARNMADAGIASALLVRGYDALVTTGEEVSGTYEHLTEAQKAHNDEMERGSDLVRQTDEDLNAMGEALGYARESFVDFDGAKEEAEKQEKAREDAAKKRRDEAHREAERQAAEYERMWDQAAKSEARRGAEAIKAAEEEAKVQEERKKTWDENIQALMDSADAAREVESAYDDWIRERQKQREESLEKFRDTAIDTLDTVSSTWVDLAHEQAVATQESHAAELDRLRTRREDIEAQVESGELTKEQGKLRLDQIDKEVKAERKAKRQARKESEKAIMAGFVAQQAAAVARATVDAAAAAVALTPAFVPIAGPLAPGAALAAAGALLTTQIAAISSTQPPEFASGGLVSSRLNTTPDHVAIGARPDEGIVSPRGMRSLGSQGLDALNRGLPPGGNGSPIIMLDSQIIGAGVTRSLRTHSGLGRELDRRAGTLPGIRGR